MGWVRRQENVAVLVTCRGRKCCCLLPCDRTTDDDFEYSKRRCYSGRHIALQVVGQATIHSCTDRPNVVTEVAKGNRLQRCRPVSISWGAIPIVMSSKHWAFVSEHIPAGSDSRFR